jgi:hypothetical protein
MTEQFIRVPAEGNEATAAEASVDLTGSGALIVETGSEPTEQELAALVDTVKSRTVSSEEEEEEEEDDEVAGDGDEEEWDDEDEEEYWEDDDWESGDVREDLGWVGDGDEEDTVGSDEDEDDEDEEVEEPDWDDSGRAPDVNPFGEPD